MSRSVVGLLAAAGAIMAGLVGLTHGDSTLVLIAGAGAGTGIAAYLALPSQKKCQKILCHRSQRCVVSASAGPTYLTAPTPPPSSPVSPLLRRGPAAAISGDTRPLTTIDARPGGMQRGKV